MNPGTLYIVGSPIGNMEDITLRALRILRESIDHVYCEDTRQTRKLLNHYNINISTSSLHAHSSDEKLASAIKILKDGKSIAYLTDSGTPGISDPGARLVRSAMSQGIPVVPVPGPSALASIISVCGFSEKNILFAGFLSKKDGKKKRELEKLKEYDGIIVVYESPYRIKKLLAAIREVFPDAELIIGREMTKIYEEFISGSSDDIFKSMDNITEKGEFAIAILNKK